MDKCSRTRVHCPDMEFVRVFCLGLSYGYIYVNTVVAVFLLPVNCLRVLFIAHKVQIYARGVCYANCGA